MTENILPEDRLPQHAVPEEPDREPQEPEPEPVETRGIGWLIVPTLLGGLVGAVIGLAQATVPHAGQPRQPLWEEALGGAVIGLVAGGVFGLLVWVVFPYKGRNPHAPPPPEEKPAPIEDQFSPGTPHRNPPTRPGERDAGAAPDARNEHIL
jgi:hypothetical protein